MSNVVTFPGASGESTERLQQRLQGLLDEQEALLTQAGRDMAAIIAPDAASLTLADLRTIAQAAADQVRQLSVEGGVSAQRADYFAEVVFNSIGEAIMGGTA